MASDVAAAVAPFAPWANGLQIGQLVEVNNEPAPGAEHLRAEEDLIGETGQIVDILADEGKLRVMMISSGRVVSIDSRLLRSAMVGYASGEGDFDVVFGPRSEKHVLCQALSDCFSDKGHCVAKVIQDAQERTEAHASLQQAEADGLLGRLAQEVEEGYLGRGGRAKVMWLDAEAPAVPPDGLVCRSDAHLTMLSELLAPIARDVAGEEIAERTPALVCMSLTDAQEMEYESSSATDQTIQEFYATWARSVMRIVIFLGPGSGTVTLKKKPQCNLPHVEDFYDVVAAPGTALMFREDALEYSYQEPDAGDASWLTAFLLKPMPDWDFGDLDGDVTVFDVPSTGPPAPTQDLCSVCAISIQSCGKMTDHHKEWAAYMAGCDGQLEMPLTRFDYHPYYDEETDIPTGKSFVKHFSVQDGIELFDNKLFEISNMEATAMDPQCRQVLEVGYLSIHQIGITKKWANTHPTHASVSVGTDKQEWLNMPDAPSNVATNNQLAIMANRFNYCFNLKGGSYVMDTACSSSLCASHLGKVNLLERRWDPLEYHLGLGAGLTLTVFSFIGSCASHMLSPGGRCFTFNATANGYNRGDGTACMLIKAGAQDAERVCYFRGSQIGQDGRSASMSAPNGPAQEKCVWGAMREARIDPPESTVWECHGTGTSLGDPIEVGAVRKVQIKMKRQEPLMIASSKSNFGHLEGSAAALAMNKCILVVIQITCAPTQHLKTLNPHLDHAAFDAFYSNEHCPYMYNAGHCQVSSFGVGGTNGHAIFWGEAKKPIVDVKQKLLMKVMNSAPPIIADGPDPADWEYSGPPFDLKDGEKCSITYWKDPVTGDEEVRFDRQLKAIAAPAEFYCTSGNHNDWTDDRMVEGDRPGLFFQEVEIPDSGRLEFRILADGEHDRSIGPEETTESRSVPIIGPGSDVRTSWIATGRPGDLMRIEYMTTQGPSGGAGLQSVSWFPVEA